MPVVYDFWCCDEIRNLIGDLIKEQTLVKIVLRIEWRLKHYDNEGPQICICVWSYRHGIDWTNLLQFFETVLWGRCEEKRVMVLIVFTLDKGSAWGKQFGG